MPYYLCYFEESTGQATGGSVRIPIKAYAIDLETAEGQGSNPNEKGNNVTPIYIDDNGNFKACAIDLTQLANKVQLVYDSTQGIATLIVNDISS